MQPGPSQQARQAHPPHERTTAPVTLHGHFDVTNWIIGTLPDTKTAQRCADALASDGFEADDLLVESPEAALQQLRAVETGERDASLLTRIVDALRESPSGEAGSRMRPSDLRAGYLREAEAGRAILGARDAQGNQTDRVRNILIEHGARYIHYFEPVEVRELG